MLAEPSGERGLVKVSTRQREHNGNDLFLGSFDAEAVQTEEEIHGLECDALVPILERVIVGKAEAVGSSESGKVGVGFVMQLIAVAGSF